MNCVQLALDHVAEGPHRPATWFPGASGGSVTTFGELFALANAMQHALVASGVQAGDLILVQDSLERAALRGRVRNPRNRATVVLIEPWMPASHIERAARDAAPKFFVSGRLGQFWGLRYRAIRSIPHKLSIRSLMQQAGGWQFIVEDTDEDRAGIITFTSGTTGAPKSVVRTQGRAPPTASGVEPLAQDRRISGGGPVHFRQFRSGQSCFGPALARIAQSLEAAAFASNRAVAAVAAAAIADLRPRLSVGADAACNASRPQKRPRGRRAGRLLGL